jgi:predicted membrane protein
MKNMSGKVLFGVILVIVGIGLLLQNLFDWFSFNFAWPLIIVAIGVYLIMRGK